MTEPIPPLHAEAYEVFDNHPGAWEPIGRDWFREGYVAAVLSRPTCRDIPNGQHNFQSENSLVVACTHCGERGPHEPRPLDLPPNMRYGQKP